MHLPPRSPRALVVFLLLLAGLQLAAAPVAAQPRSEALTSAVETARSSLGVEGVSVAVIGRDGQLASAVSGEAQKGEPVAANTAFEIGSISKVVTGALALIAERGEGFALEDRLATWFPQMPQAEQISVRQMLNHTSGLADPLQVPAFTMKYFLNPAGAPDAAGVLGAVGEADFEPGRAWKYSNTGFIATALILERVADASFEQLLTQQLLAPQEISGVASFRWPENTPHRAAHGFRDLSGSGTYVDLSALSPSEPFLRAAVGAGSLIASAPDLARLVRAIVAGDVLSDEEKRAMQQWVDRPDGHEYGLGLLRIVDDQGRELLGHRGNSAGFSGEAWHLPEQNLTVVVLSNRGGLLVREITEAVLDVVAPIE